jgi:hypothetical protein
MLHFKVRALKLSSWLKNLTYFRAKTVKVYVFNKETFHKTFVLHTSNLFGILGCAGKRDTNLLLVFNCGQLYVHSASDYTCLQSDLFVFLSVIEQFYNLFLVSSFKNPAISMGSTGYNTQKIWIIRIPCICAFHVIFESHSHDWYIWKMTVACGYLSRWRHDTFARVKIPATRPFATDCQ